MIVRGFTPPVLCAAMLLSIGTESGAADKATPSAIGETFIVDSKILGEPRLINVCIPAGYHESPDSRLPVLSMPDGGIAEDFLHVAGLLQVSAASGTIRPHLLVGIEKTRHRRDLTGPTENEDDRNPLKAFRAVLKPGSSGTMLIRVSEDSSRFPAESRVRPANRTGCRALVVGVRGYPGTIPGRGNGLCHIGDG